MWKICCFQINRVFSKYNGLVHTFVLMDNHYHLIASASEEFPLGVIMCDVQKAISKAVIKSAGRTNHIFGGPYKASLIDRSDYYHNVFKYVYMNPVRANCVTEIERYKFSSLVSDAIHTCSPISGISELIPKDIIPWLNFKEDDDSTDSIRKGLRRTNFKPVITKNSNGSAQKS